MWTLVWNMAVDRDSTEGRCKYKCGNCGAFFYSWYPAGYRETIHYGMSCYPENMVKHVSGNVYTKNLSSGSKPSWGLVRCTSCDTYDKATLAENVTRYNIGNSVGSVNCGSGVKYLRLSTNLQSARTTGKMGNAYGIHEGWVIK